MFLQSDKVLYSQFKRNQDFNTQQSIKIKPLYIQILLCFVDYLYDITDYLDHIAVSMYTINEYFTSHNVFVLLNLTSTNLFTKSPLK